MDTTTRALLRKYEASGDPADAAQAAHALFRLAGGLPINIPTLGSRITLTQDWTFTLIGEHRNTTFWNKMHGEPAKDDPVIQTGYGYYVRDGERYPRNLAERTTVCPAATILRVDRIYIRSGQKDFDSVSFVCESMPSRTPDEKRAFTKKGTPKTVGRFWAPLFEVNRIIGAWDISTLPGPRTVEAVPA